MRMAIVDGGSFVLPYDYHLAEALVGQGLDIDFFGSRTRYNGEFLDALRALPGVAVHARSISGTVAPRWKGALAYCALLWNVWRERRRYAAVNLQFSALWPLELPVLAALRSKLVFTVHNAVPHGFAGERHRPTAWIADLARALVFPSRFTHDDFIRRYGERFSAKAIVVAHGVSPIQPGSPGVRYRRLDAPEALVYWSRVEPYKGVEIFADLARCERTRSTGLALEVHGAWASELRGLRDELAGLGVKVEAGYLDAPRLSELLAREVVFLLPYRAASQSGALYSLLHHGCFFICADVGDLGEFMRRFGLDALLLRDRSAAAVADCLAWLQANAEEAARAFQAAQDASAWHLTTAGLAATIAALARNAETTGR